MSEFQVFVRAANVALGFSADDRNALLPIILASIEHPNEGSIEALETAIAAREGVLEAIAAAAEEAEEAAEEVEE